jgi:ubiquinone/menaquinone biosynthesis C-methylase UbiE
MKDDVLKTRAVELHTEQAGEFVARYQQWKEDPYRSTFTYGRKKIEELLERELQTLPAGATILDVGCGTGFNVRRLGDRGFTISGIEPSPAMRREAIATNPGVSIIDADIEAIPLPDASFDAVLAIEVVRYLRDPSRAFAELVRVTRPGGLIFVTGAPLLSLNGYSLINLVTGRVKIPTFTKVRHSFLTAAGAEHLARDAGCSSVRVHGAFLGPFHVLGRISPAVLGGVLRRYEALDQRLADQPLLRDLSNHLVIVARR